MDAPLIINLVTSLGLPGGLVIFLLMRESKKEAERAKETKEREDKNNQRFENLEDFCRTTMLDQIKESNKILSQSLTAQDNIIMVASECTRVMQKLRAELNERSGNPSKY